MYDTERDDKVKKNFEWLNNMLLIIEKYEYKNRIRRSRLALTVDVTEHSRSRTTTRSAGRE